MIWNTPLDKVLRTSRLVRRVILDHNLPAGYPIKWGNQWDLPIRGNLVPTGLTSLTWTGQEWIDFINKHLDILNAAKKINMPKENNKKSLQWRVNTPQLMREILGNNETAILGKPLSIFSRILAEVGERASELNDPKLNALMCRLAIYEVSDPYNENYDAELTNATIEAGR